MAVTQSQERSKVKGKGPQVLQPLGGQIINKKDLYIYMVALAHHHVKVSLPHIQAVNYRFVHVPQELKLAPQWVTWKWGKLRDNGKREKKPCTPQTGMAADITNPATWGTYLQALIAYSQGGYDGIGFVFNGHSYTGIDLDNVLHDGKITTWAEDIIRQFPGAYVEVSPSGKG